MNVACAPILYGGSAATQHHCGRNPPSQQQAAWPVALACDYNSRRIYATPCRMYIWRLRFYLLFIISAVVVISRSLEYNMSFIADFIWAEIRFSINKKSISPSSVTGRFKTFFFNVGFVAILPYEYIRGKYDIVAIRNNPTGRFLITSPVKENTWLWVANLYFSER